jgi:hypothetical protein
MTISGRKCDWIIKKLNQDKLLLAYFPCFIRNGKLVLLIRRIRKLITTGLQTSEPNNSFIKLGTNFTEPGSSVSTVSGYRLDDRAIEVRSSAEAKDISSILCVQTGSEAHPASCTMGTGGPFPGAKARPGRDADHYIPYSAEVRMSRSYTSPHKRLRGV